ncbi:MAG: glycosyltransferase family 2 protein [Planctomycetota bacterium]
MSALALVALLATAPLLLVLVQSMAAGLAHMRQRRRKPTDDAGLPSLRILMPAHEEAGTIDATLRQLKRVLHDDGVPATVTVIADNCSDNTAIQAQRHGVHVLQRDKDQQRGKGYALAWGMEQIATDPDWDAVVVMDADVIPDRGLFRALARELRQSPVVQSFNLIDHGDDPRSRLMALAWALINCTRPLGRYALGGSGSITGYGFGIRREVMQQVPFAANGALAEDLEHGLALVHAGYRVRPVPDAVVYSIAEGASTARSQRTRWEAGRLHAVLRWWPRLLMRPRWASLESALDLLVPPLALPGVVLIGVAALAAVSGDGTALILALVGCALTLLALLLTCLVARLPISLLSSLAWAPVYLLWKLSLYLTPGFWQQRRWERTHRQQELV